MGTHLLAMLVFAAAVMGAVPPREIPPPAGGGPRWTLVVPADSLVTYQGLNEYRNPTFASTGFVLSGEFALTLMDVCSEPGGPSEECLLLELKPDLSIARRLPHYKSMGSGPDYIIISNEKKLVYSLSSRTQRAALLAGKLRSVTGRTSIIVDQFEAGSDCESPWFSARFVALAKPPKLARTEFGGGVGCGH